MFKGVGSEEQLTYVELLLSLGQATAAKMSRSDLSRHPMSSCQSCLEKCPAAAYLPVLVSCFLSLPFRPAFAGVQHGCGAGSKGFGRSL